ncbi:MAG: DUF2148 domain-containing protein [Anaerovoracaceae bacterium]|nr:DUF2148 domain-containing protein [Bacillota bacterium]MDY3954957.1 DUF2148 domain-containing protein [Anaerovoracaceae bacterium]
MKLESWEAEKRAALAAADAMITAARTAPKACGVDHIEMAILDGADKDKLAEEMRAIAKKTGQTFFERDACNVDRSHYVVVIGVTSAPRGLSDCGLCGFLNCADMEKNKGRCAMNLTDLGIAVGSAVSIAADCRVDNRVMFSAGMAAKNLKILPEDVKICYGIPVSVSGKNPYFDRKPLK